MSNWLTKEKMKSLNHSFQNLKTYSESVEPLLKIFDSNMTQNEHVYAICCRPEVTGDVIFSSANVKTLNGYAVLNFEVASLSSSRDIKKVIS